MFKIESYVTPILLSYVDKYVKDFKPADAQVSLWGGGVALHNLVLKADVLQQEVALPFTLVSGRIHELLIQVPWTKIMSESIIVTIDTIECVLSLNPPTPSEESPPPESPSRKTQVVEAPPGYMQALVRRIVSNIALRVHHLIVKYVQDDIVMSFNVKHLAVDSAGPNWEPAFADIDQTLPVIRRLVRLDDLTLCLDRTDSDGKIRFYQEPLLYKCQLDLRVLTRLVSANTRRASSLKVQLRSTKLAWGVTSEQLTLLLRLMRERSATLYKPPPPVPKQSSVTQVPLHATSSNSAEPARSESWSEWAWSWLPTWMDREGGVEEAPMPASPTPVHFSAYLDDVSLVFKVMELDGGNRKRSRGVLELSASHAAMKSYICAPTALRVRMALRTLVLQSNGKCVCGHLDYNAANDESTVYVKRVEAVDEGKEPWKWPEAEFNDEIVETAEVAQEGARSTPDSDPDYDVQPPEQSDHGLPEEPSPEPKDAHEEVDELWQQMAPVVYMEFVHERSPPHIYVNPYENPPLDFQHSDWAEECNLKVQIEPVEIKVCTGLIHRFAALRSIYADLPPVPDIELPMKVLTVEECEALCDNLPQRRISIEAKGLYVRLVPWDHSSSERSLPPPLVLDVHLPKSTVVINGPLYPHRVCSAACQLPDDVGPLWQGARLHVSVSAARVQAGIRAPADPQPLPCARTDMRLVMHILLYKEYFTKRESVVFSYSFKIREANICGSAARLQAAWHIPMTLFKERASTPLRYSTLAKDALNDEEAVAVDLTVEEFGVRGYLTRNINTHIMTIHSARATAYHAPKGAELKQAWLFSAPDTPTTSPYLRAAIQWCTQPIPNGLEYVGIWMEPTAICVDPLFIAWLAYKPQLKSYLAESQTLITSKSLSSTQYFLRRRTTPPSSSGRGISRSGSGADMVHVKPRSVGSSSEPSEKKDKRSTQPVKQVESQWWSGDRLLGVHARLRRMLVNVEMGLVLVYVTMTTASAIDCATVRDAMERHASASQGVIALSLGRLLMHSSSVIKHLWHEIRHDGPTFTNTTPDQNAEETDSFPWKMRLADVSCYTLEMRSGFPKEKTSGLRSQLKTPTAVTPRTVIELVTTTVTLSVVTKSLQIKTTTKKEHKKHAETSADEMRTKYFTSGMDFKPATLKEFVRGPARRKKATDQEQKPEAPPASSITKGPVVSLGVHLHADTPPIIVRLERDQVHVVAATLHCFKHIVTLLQRGPLTVPLHTHSTAGGPHRTLIRSVSELEEVHTPSDETLSENRSELISIFEAQSAADPLIKLKTFFWFQWVVSRATLVIATQHAKLAFDIDDIISTMDLQSHYNQLRIKLASASVRHYERVGSDEWTAGVLSGRVLEAREPTNAKEENHFLAITITQAQISNLPPSWKEELHPKLLEQKANADSMWEIYATLAPLEGVLRPIFVEHIALLIKEMAPRSFCPLHVEVEPTRVSAWQWPFCYVTAGGLRLLVTCEEDDLDTDDTFMFVIGKVSVNPHPENPICRRAVTVATDANWITAGGSFEGRQYEVLVNNVAIRSAQFSQIVNQEESEQEMLKGIGGENPALKWSQPVVSPVITPVLHSLDLSCVIAPALYVSGVLMCGPALEFNLITDCAVELSINQLDLVRRVATDMYSAVRECDHSGILFDEEKHGVCPYATLLMARDTEELPTTLSDATIVDAADSGVDTTSHSTFKSGRNTEDNPVSSTKKTVTVAFVEQMADASEHLEVFVTMGTVELSLYTADDGSSDVIELRPPKTDRPKTPEPALQVIIEESREPAKQEDVDSPGGSRSITETIRNVDMGKSKLELMNVMPHARKSEGNLPLLHVTLQQPNFYYWKNKIQKTVQVSLFNAWVGLGVGQLEGRWNLPLFSTAKGDPDPVSDIPPALATMKMIAPIGSVGYITSSSSNACKGSVKLDIERPILFNICMDRLRRLKGIYALVDKHVLKNLDYVETAVQEIPALYRLRKIMVQHGLESITVSSSQIALSGAEGTVGWDTATLQIAAGLRPERLIARASVTALLLAAGAPADRRHVVLQPLMLGAELEASWEAWRRAEGGLSAREPTVRISLELDYVTIDLRPADLGAINRIRTALDAMFGRRDGPSATSSSSSDNVLKARFSNTRSSLSLDRRSVGSADTASWEVGDHYYKDDLRSGAFKIVSGGQLPMAYQVMLYGSCVSWRYPHPRAITRVIVFPLPGQDKETECVLEFYSPMLAKWEPHTYFNLPVGEPRELQLQVVPPEAVFAQTWRFRARYDTDPKDPPYEFSIAKFLPKTDPFCPEVPPEPPTGRRGDTGVTAEQLSGVLRVDSYFAPRLLARTKLIVRMVSLEIHAHNSLPYLSSQATALEGYYVSRPLMRSHRVLTIAARGTTAHVRLGSPAGILLLLDTKLSSDILESSTGAVEGLVDEFSAQVGLSLPDGSMRHVQARLGAGDVRVHLLVPRLRTLLALAADWTPSVNEYRCETPSCYPLELIGDKATNKRELADAAAAALEGRVSLWIHNSCASALRIGQEGTDEVVPLGPGARLAYRWRSPTAPKQLRFAFAGPAAEWHWSNSIPFSAGKTRVRLEDSESVGSSRQIPGAGVFVHAKIEETGARRCLHLSGRLALVNMLRFDLLYKVRARCPESNQWRTVCSGELTSETVGRTVLCGAECEMVIKIKLMTHDTGWSGDIPLKECPKENVPWLVKVPSEGEVPYMSVWCRVVRARSDGRILATVWPLYVLHSHLPLDTDVLITTETGLSSAELTPEQSRPPPLIQTTPGRGTSTHLLAPGTTAARHSLSFQYRNIECPVTREAVPLYYGVTDTSVFDKRMPVANIDEVIDDILRWLNRSSRNAVSSWPYSVVAKHWPGIWQPALLQPRCDVTVRYQAVRAGGGCCLEIQLCPVVLLCNATPIALTLRAHDAAPLCKLEPGSAISPPSAVLKKPLFMSVEMGRETFVSGQLAVSADEPGRYGAPPPGHVTLDRAADFAIQCNQKVALMTLYYEIKENINVLGVSSTYVLLNRLDTDILVSAVAVPNEVEEVTVLRPKTFKVISPTKPDSIHGAPLCRFWLRGRWRGGDPAELRVYLCLALPAGAYPACAPIPVRLGAAPVRRALALVDQYNKSMAVVVTQVKHEGRWLIAVNKDPCPQFVVHNLSRGSLMIAQPLHTNDEPSTSAILAKPECAGTRWWCMVRPDAVTHYSSPAHCERYPPPQNSAPHSHNVPFLTFSKGREEGDPDWCQPVAVTDGEQLVQLSGGATIKMRVRTHPHSTLIELHDVDERDISASDIRRRLLGAFSSESIKSLMEQKSGAPVSANLERIGADDKLLDHSEIIYEGGGPLRIHSEELFPQARPSQRSIRTSFLVDVVNSNEAGSTMLLYPEEKKYEPAQEKAELEDVGLGIPRDIDAAEEASFVLPHEVNQTDWEESGAMWSANERVRCVVAGVVVSLASCTDAPPLLALHVDRAALLVLTDHKKTKTIISIADVQIDNMQYESGQYDFAVVASTRAERTPRDLPPPLWTLFSEKEAFATKHADARVLLRLQHDKWNVVNYKFKELTELDIRVGPLAVYVEDAYVSALVELSRLALPAATPCDAAAALAEERTLATPLRVRSLLVQPLDLTLTLHTAVRMYIALDQSPLRLSAFKLHEVMTSTERLTHALTVHYLSAAILGAGWVVGGLELLGAPGALAARLGSATGGVRGVASAAAAALLRSLSAWAGSLARNLDLLAGDEEHARRAAAARRRPPPSLMAGLVAGITNFAINILGAVGGLAHHPLVGVAVGETESGAAALRRGLLGALTKPLSATADLVAYAGHGLLSQTGWDPVPQPRSTRTSEGSTSGWRRDCVRWTFRLAELTALAGFEVLLDNAPLQLLLTHKFLVVADPETERVVEMIDLRFCTLGSYQGTIIELVVMQRRQSKLTDTRAIDDDDEYQISAAAMARVARYTGAEGACGAAGAGGVAGGVEARVLSLLPRPGHAHALHAALAAALHHNAETHFPLL